MNKDNININININNTDTIDNQELPNEETEAAIEEGDKLVADKATKRYNSVEELKKDLGI